jgi:hypothetical protein
MSCRGETVLQFDKIIDALRRGTLDFDCKRMVLAQLKEGGERFEEQGYIRQSPEGTLIFKIYVSQHNAKPFGHLVGKAGHLYGEDALYDLEVVGYDARDGLPRAFCLIPHGTIATAAFSSTVR